MLKFNDKLNKIFLIINYLIITIIVWVPLSILFFSIETLKTLIFWIVVLFLLIIPIVIIINWKLSKLYLSIIIFLVYVFVLLWFQKNEWIYNNFSLICVNDCPKYNWNPLNAISEKELLNMWFKSAWFLWINDATLNSFKYDILNIEKNIKIELPSQIPNAILDNVENEKYFLYKPEKNNNTLLILLHGSAGWFQYYQKLFKELADENWIIIASPNYWWWEWQNEWWTKLVMDVYNKLYNEKIINKNTKIILLWVSNWWRWLTRLIEQDNNNIFSKVVFISWVIEKSITDKANFLNNLKTKKLFVIHWVDDDRVWFNYIQDFIASTNSNNLKTLIFEKWDHFILGTEFDKIKPELVEFIKN